MFLIIGLGNPGLEYISHRHNIGFMAVDTITHWYTFGSFRTCFQAQVAEGIVAGVRVLAMKPLTYMNHSGRAVGAAVGFFKIPLNKVIVFHDELDLAPGKVRVKTGGSPAGHKGLKSIDAHVSCDYRRVRLGIGHPGHRNYVTKHVLHDFDVVDHLWLKPLLDVLADSLPYLLLGDNATFMTHLAHKDSPHEITASLSPP